MQDTPAKPRLIMATNNPGKITEMRLLLGDRFNVLSLREIGLDVDVEETGDTFEQNALIKAEAILSLTGCAALADDSGLMVDALDGRPGVLSARFAGAHGDDAANNRLLLEQLQGVQDPRTARFVSVIALTRPEKIPLIARGECEGQIIHEYRGDGGFGYDPLFLSNDLHVTFGEASTEAKAGISHRGRAIRKLLQMLESEDETDA